MATAADFFRTAAAHLRRGVDAKRMEIDQIRREIDQQTRAIQNEIEGLRREIAHRESLIAQPNPAEKDLLNRHRAQLLMEVQRIQAEIAAKEHDIIRMRDQRTREIADRERDLQNLMQQVSDLESKR